MNFLPISILAYTFNAGSIIIDKILIQNALPKPIVYTFYVNVLQLLVVVLIPFGFSLQINAQFYWAVVSGIISVFALFALFTSLKLNAATLVGPIVGALNPLFAAIIGGVFLGQVLNATQYLAIGILILGSLVLAFNFSTIKLKLNLAFWWMVASGFLFGLSFVLLREAFLGSDFINGLVVSRIAAGAFALTFLLIPSTRASIFQKQESTKAQTKQLVILLAIGQSMGAISGLLTSYAVSLANPALVNSLFGVQYVVILGAALILYKKHPHLLEEKLSRNIMIQKGFGVVILSIGLYLLAK